MRRLAILILANVGLSGCATALYDWNLKHEHVEQRAHLTQKEVEQITRTVTNKSLSVIIGMSRFSDPGKPDEVRVYTELDRSTALMMVYDLHKDADGLWRIVDQGEGTIIVY